MISYLLASRCVWASHVKELLRKPRCMFCMREGHRNEYYWAMLHRMQQCKLTMCEH